MQTTVAFEAVQAPPGSAPARPGLATVTPLHRAPQAPGDAVEPIGSLPGEWMTLQDVAVPDGSVDRVVLGPNGLFAVTVDPDLRPAAVRPGRGLFRAGDRVPDPVKHALRAAGALRRRLEDMDCNPYPYPVLVTPVPGEAGYRLGRLLVVRPGRLAEVVWSNPSRPLLRSQRAAIEAALLG